jgi:uncharacterized RDD family membrane protein YckC
MTGPGPESSPPPQTPPSVPPGPGPAAPPPPASAWTSSITSTAPTPGPAGLFYADVPNRIFAYIIDAIILAIVNFVISIILFAIVGNPTTVTTVQDPNALLGVRIDTSTNIISSLLYAIVALAVSAGYFIYTWTAPTMRGTVGMRALGMQVGNAADGATLTRDQAVRRWLALGGIFALVQALNPLPLLGILLGLVSLVYVIFLLVTTAQSPTKQGWHDKFAGTIVAKAARSVA